MVGEPVEQRRGHLGAAQELGDNPMSVMMHQIMTLFDEYQSRENAKHTLRAIKENARQGY